MARWLASLIPLALLTAPAAAQLPPDKALAAMKVADGLQVELFASEPMLINPTSMDVDHKGRVWVAEAVNYRRVNFKRPILREEGDRIVVLTDKDGDGKADESTVFYQGKELYGPLGVCVAPLASRPGHGAGNGLRVFVCQSPDILVFDDADGDLKADGPPKKFLTGFGGFDHDHGVHGVNIGPDGKLYFTVGDVGVTALQGADKKGKVWKSNDKDVQKGTVWRCDIDGGNLELIAHNFRNNYECCVDSFGEVWLSDNDDDGNQQTRICFVMPGGNYGYGPRGAGQTHWHEEQPGIVHKTLRTGFGSPTGITFYEGSLLPKKYQGHLLHCDAGPREVRAFIRKPKGAGYELDKEVLLTSTDNWFRPSDVCVGPDGSAFVADWYDPGVGGHGMGDWTRGRIYRLTPKGHVGYKVPEVKLDTTEGVLAALASPCQATRAVAINRLASTPLNEVVPVLQAGSIQREDAILAARSWLQGAVAQGRTEDYLTIRRGIWEGEVEEQFLQLFVRSRGYNKLPFLGVAQIEKTSVVARREHALHLRNIELSVAAPLFYSIAKGYDGKDIFYRAALNIACGTDPARRDAILADFDKHFPEWNDTVADLVWELRPKSVLPRLETLLADAKLTGPQKARIVDILAASDDATAGRTMLSVLKSAAAPEVKARAIEQLRLFLPTKWKGLQGGKDLSAAVSALLADPATQATGLQLVAAVGAVDQIDIVASIVADTKTAIDIRKEAVRTLGKLPDDKAVAALISAGSPENPLSVPAIQALGELLPKTPKPPAYSTKALDALTRGVNAADRGTPELKSAALAALAGNRAGTVWLLDAHGKKALPADLTREAGILLRNTPYPDLRNKALIVFPAPGKLDPKKLPPAAELAKRPGNADRGKKVWDASFTGAAQCAKCHTVRGFGGQVGPDLSMIGKKGSRENLFESILLPSKAIADQYVQQSVTTAAGLTVAGLVTADTPQAITLRDANGKDTVIPKADVEATKKLQISIMPEDVIASLTEDELIDLVSYLQTLQTAALSPDTLRVAGPFAAGSMTEALKTEFGPEKEPYNPTAQYPPAADGRKTPLIPWRTIRADAKAYFDLAALHGDAGVNSASYLYAEFDSPADQDAEILLGTDDGAKVRVNGKEVFAHEKAIAAAPAQEKVAVKLVKGKNAVLLKVANGSNPHGAYFTLLSGQEVKMVGK